MEPEYEVVTWSSYLGFHSSDGQAALEGYKLHYWTKYLSTVQELVNLFGFLLWRVWQENNKKS